MPDTFSTRCSVMVKKNYFHFYLVSKYKKKVKILTPIISETMQSNLECIQQSFHTPPLVLLLYTTVWQKVEWLDFVLEEKSRGWQIIVWSNLVSTWEQTGDLWLREKSVVLSELQGDGGAGSTGFICWVREHSYQTWMSVPKELKSCTSRLTGNHRVTLT